MPGLRSFIENSCKSTVSEMAYRSLTRFYSNVYKFKALDLIMLNCIEKTKPVLFFNEKMTVLRSFIENSHKTTVSEMAYRS